MNTVILMRTRKETRPVHVRGVQIGGRDHVVIQTMLKHPPKETEAALEEIARYRSLGAEILRLAVRDMDDARAIGTLRKQTDAPLVADIHFDHELALEALEQGVDKIRINPGNIGSEAKVRRVADACRARGVPIRIGVNAGSLERDLLERHGRSATAMVESARRHVKLLEEAGFEDIVLSLKASDVTLASESYLQAAKAFPYPLHLGITEAGTLEQGTIQSAAGLGTLLYHGIGDTLRISLTASREDELRIARKLLVAYGLKQGAKLVTCPTCGRLQYDLEPLAKRVEAYLEANPLPITVAIMGCAVNGPQEASEADVGIAGGKGEGLLFIKGRIVRKVPEAELYDALIEAIEAKREDA